MKDKENLKEILEALGKAKNRPMLEDLILGLTTEHERDAFAKRLDIVKRLLKGEQQHAIATDLLVGVATVTRGSHELAAGRFKALSK